MPKLPRISGTEAVRALQRLGFEVIFQKRSHIVMRRESSGCIVPNHREVKIGPLTGVIRQAGISADEFITAL